MLRQGFLALSLPLFALLPIAVVASACDEKETATSDLDASTDASPDVRRPSTSASPDAGEVRRWCADQVETAFCADFDGEDGAEGWDSVVSGELTSLVSSDRSAPQALHVVEPAVANSNEAKAPLFVKRLPFTSKVARVALDLRVDQVGLDADEVYAMSPVDLLLGHTKTTTDGTETQFLAMGRLDLTKAKTEFLACPPAGDCPSPAGESTDIPRGSWVHVEIAIDLSTSPVKASMTFDGVPAAEATYPVDVTQVNSLELHIGEENPHAHPQPFEATFDDVVLELQ